MSHFNQALTAMRLIRERNQLWIPREIRNRSLLEVFVFHGSTASFAEALRPHVGVFARAAGVAPFSAEDAAASLFGFAPPTNRREDRKVHVSVANLQKEPDPVGALAHEYVHCVSHPSFYPALFLTDPPRGFFKVEGATEFLTVKASAAHPATGITEADWLDFYLGDDANVPEAADEVCRCFREWLGVGRKLHPLDAGKTRVRTIAYPSPFQGYQDWAARQYPRLRRRDPSFVPRIDAVLEKRIRNYVLGGIPYDLSGVAVPADYDFQMDQ